VNRADQALYASKASGRNCAHWHNGRDIVALSEASSRPAAAAAPVTSAGRERRKEEFARVCDELRRKLIDVVSQQA
jgi:hypothetical protein